MVKVVMVVLFVLGLCSGGHSSAADFPFFAKSDGGKTVNVIATFLATFPEHAVFFHYQNHTRHLVDKVLAKSSSSLLANGVIALNYDSVSDPKTFHFPKQLLFVHVFLVQQLNITDKMVDINKHDSKFGNIAFILNAPLHTRYVIIELFKATFFYQSTAVDAAAHMHATCYYCAQRHTLTQLPIDDDDDLQKLVVRNFTHTLNYTAQPLILLGNTHLETFDPQSPKFQSNNFLQWFFYDMEESYHLKLQLQQPETSKWDIACIPDNPTLHKYFVSKPMFSYPVNILYSASATGDMEPWQALLATFDSSVWMWLIVSVLALTLVAAYFIRKSTTTTSMLLPQLIADNLLLLVEQPLPSIHLYRQGRSSMLIAIWLLAAFVLLNAYRGAMTGHMLKTSYTEYGTMEELLDNNYAFYADEVLFIKEELARKKGALNTMEKVALRTTVINFSSYYEYVKKSSFNRIGVIGYEIDLNFDTLSHRALGQFSAEQENNFRLLEESLFNQNYVIILPLCLPVYGKIYNFVEDYRAGHLHQFFYNTLETAEKIPRGKSIHSEKFYQKRQRHFLESKHFYGIIISVWLYGLSLALVIFTLEITVDGIIKYDVIQRVIRFVVYVYTLLRRLYRWLKATIRALVRQMIAKCAAKCKRRRRRNRITQQPQVVVQRSTSCHDIAVIDLE